MSVSTTVCIVTPYNNYAYIPNSVYRQMPSMPYDVLYGSLYSFVLDSSQHQEVFTGQTKDALAQLGFQVNFVENNGAAFWASVTPLRRSALTGWVIYSLVLLLALGLAVFLYLSQRRKDYAILRALGVPHKQANRQVILPILLMGAAGVLAGGIPAWNYALEKSAGSLSQLVTPGRGAALCYTEPVDLGRFERRAASGALLPGLGRHADAGRETGAGPAGEGSPGRRRAQTGSGFWFPNGRYSDIHWDGWKAFRG